MDENIKFPNIQLSQSTVINSRTQDVKVMNILVSPKCDFFLLVEGRDVLLSLRYHENDRDMWIPVALLVSGRRLFFSLSIAVLLSHKVSFYDRQELLTASCLWV